MTRSREDKLAARPEIAERAKSNPGRGRIITKRRRLRVAATLIQDQLAAATDLGVVDVRRIRFLVDPLPDRHETARFSAGCETASS